MTSCESECREKGMVTAKYKGNISTKRWGMPSVVCSVSVSVQTCIIPVIYFVQRVELVFIETQMQMGINSAKLQWSRNNHNAKVKEERNSSVTCKFLGNLFKCALLPPAFEGWREVIFSLCVLVHTSRGVPTFQVWMWGVPTFQVGVPTFPGLDGGTYLPRWGWGYPLG